MTSLQQLEEPSSFLYLCGAEGERLALQQGLESNTNKVPNANLRESEARLNNSAALF